MTKRVLSLLLALVMALSLCVPAFAADDNEQEPAAEVNKVEAVATEPEAEAEPEAEVAPVAADEPMPIATISTTTLEALVVQAKGMSPVADWQNSAGTDSKDERDALTNALKDAQNILDDIEEVGGVDIWALTHTQGEVNDAANKLASAIAALTDKATDDQIAYLKSVADKMEDLLEEGTDWYTQAYLDKVQAALDAANAAVSDGKYKSYVAAKKLADAVWPGQYDALNPGSCGSEWVGGITATYEDYLKVQAAYDAAYKTLYSGEYVWNAQADALKDKLDAIKAYINYPTRPNHMANWVKVHDTVVDIEALSDLVDALSKDGYTLKITNATVAGSFEFIEVSWSTGNRNEDQHSYVVKASYNGGELKDIFTQANGIPDTSDPTNWDPQTGSFWVNASTFGLKTFPVNSKVVINFYDKASGELVATRTVEVTAYNGPVIDSVVFNDADEIVITLNKSLGYANNHINDGAYQGLYFVVSDPSGKVVGTGEKGKTAGLYTNDRGDDVTVWKLKLDKKTAAVGKYSVELYVIESDAAGLNSTIGRDSDTVEVKDITSYVTKYTASKKTPYVKTGYNSLLAAIEVAKGMTEYVANPTVTTFTTSQVRDILKHNIEYAEAFVAKAATTPNTSWNRAECDLLLKNLDEAIGNMIEGADSAAFEDALAALKALIPSDYKNYKTIENTFGSDTLTGIEALIKAAEAWAKNYLPLANTSANKAVLAACTKVLTDAKAHLQVLVPNAEIKTLQALVDSVPAKLAADNYTAESKAAVEAAAAEAKALIAKKGVLKSEIDASIEKLTAALNALEIEKEPVPVGPQAPASGTGWVRDGNDWYYFENGTLQYSKWIYMKGSGLWYYVGADAKMLTGLRYVENNWYLFRTGGSTIGCALSGWQDISAYRPLAGKTNWGWFTTSHKGNFGKCTYTTEWGDIQIS